ncbi:MAG: site-specific integrase [Prevotellaceae bacterium]|nr:site-specific integrase [Prevotellaceae bacterium]
MATLKAFIRTSIADKNKLVNVRFRLSDGRDFQLFHKSEFSVLPDKWDAQQQCIKARSIFDATERAKFNNNISERKKIIRQIYLRQGKNLTSELLDEAIDKEIHPEKYEIQKKSFFELFEHFLNTHPLSDVRRKNYRSVLRALQRFELYTNTQASGQTDFILDVDSMGSDALKRFEDFLREEHKYYNEFPELYQQFSGHRPNEPRGTNTLVAIFSKLRAFFIWCNKNGYSANRPFDNYHLPTEIYGTPYYITIDERNALYNFDLTANAGLEKQRDIFIFQCVIGCRIGDLYRFTKRNIINGAIEYVAGKTREEKPKTLRVPLNSIATEILAKYASLEGERLLPFISEQKYNVAIKKAFLAAGITRNVTVLNPLTRQSEIRPLNEIASSHLARRTFCGNLYKKVKDPNLVGSLSGHVEGSKAFARYREIDDEIKKELVTMIE